MISQSSISSFILPISLLAFLYMVFSYRKKRQLEGKVVLITGANSGLGKACAKVFHYAKCRVILCGRKKDSLEKVKEELIELKVPASYTPEIILLDLENLDSIPCRIKEALQIYSHIDILINNAGISYRGEITHTTLDVDIKLMTINYFAQIAIIKELVPSMKSRKSGFIVNISSVQGKIAVPYRSSYTATKHALQSFSDTLRAEVYKDGIHVCVINPAYIRTNLSHNAMCGDGSQYGVMDHTTKSGMDPSYVARKILSAVENHQSEVTLAPIHYRLVIYLRSIFPNLYFKIMEIRSKSGEKDYRKCD